MTDTGPEYPPGPLPGSNGIGVFEIGVSPIGELPSFDVWTTIISQYANSPILDTLIENLFDYIDPTYNLEQFYDYIWNINTAQGYGLDVWGRIVGVNRVLKVTVGDWFGFAEATPGAETFDYGPFYSGAVLTENYTLSDQAYRRLIFAKAASNITNGSIPAINQILMGLFPNRGNAYVTEGVDNGAWFGFAESTNSNGFDQEPFYNGSSIANMVMTYTFAFTLTPLDLAIVQNSGVLPKSTGVEARIAQI